MATGGDFKILISDEKDNVKVYVNQRTTIKEIKEKFLVEAKNVEKERSKFHLLKDDCLLDDDATVRSSKITKGDVLIIINEEQKKFTRSAVTKVIQSPYGAVLTRKKNVIPLKMRRTRSEPPYRSRAKETIPTDQKDEHREIKQQNQFADRKAASSPVLLQRNVQTSPMEQRKVMLTTLHTAPDFEKHRPLSTMTIRSSSTNSLSTLGTDLLRHDEMEKAVEYRLSASSAENLKLSEALRPFVGDLNASVQNAELLSAKLLQEGLITNALHRDIINTMGWSNSLKTSKLIDSVRIQLKTSPRPIEVLKSFFQATSYDPALTKFITKIEEYIGISVTEVQTPNVRKMMISARSRCNKCVISEEDIASIMYRTAIDVQHKWFILGIELNLQMEKLTEIKQSHSDPGSCYAEMMHAWIHSSSNPTWQILTRYLIRPLELEGLATELRKEYCYTCCY